MPSNQPSSQPVTIPTVLALSVLSQLATSLVTPEVQRAGTEDDKKGSGRSYTAAKCMGPVLWLLVVYGAQGDEKQDMVRPSQTGFQSLQIPARGSQPPHWAPDVGTPAPRKGRKNRVPERSQSVRPLRKMQTGQSTIQPFFHDRDLP